jgi:hypothetical protein
MVCCCEKCFNKILSGEGTTDFAKRIRKLAQEKIKIVWDNQWCGYVDTQQAG